MTLVNIDVSNVASSFHEDDKVIFYAPAHRSASGGGVTNTAPETVPLVGGKADVDLKPGPVFVRMQCRGIADTSEKQGTVPDAGPVTLDDVLGGSYEYTPAVISAVQEARSDTEAARDEAVEAADRVGTAEQVETWASDAQAAASTAEGIASDLPTTISTELDTRVPPLVTDTLAQDSTITTAAESAVSDAVVGLDLMERSTAEGLIDATNWVRPDLPDGTDFNTVRTSGMHPITAAASMATMTNRPSGANGTGALIVRNVRNTVFQELWWWTSTGRKTAYRVTSSGVFGAWTHSVEPGHRHNIDDIDGLRDALGQVGDAGDSWIKPAPANGTDFDTVRTSGAYPVESAAAVATMVNRPPGANGTGVLIVYASGPTVFQEFLWWTSAGVRGQAHRVTSGGVFNPWQIGSGSSEGGGGNVSYGVISPKEKHFTVDGRLAPVLADTTRITGWGSSSLGNMKWEFIDLAREMGVEYYSGAKGGEKIEHIAARMGAVPALISPVTIPASGAVNVTSPNLPPNLMMLPFDGWLGGVHGTLSSSGSTLTFTRTTPGDAVTLAEPEELATDIDASLWETVTIVSAGKNNATDTDAVERVVDYTARMVRHLTPLFPRFIVMGHYFNQDWHLGDARRGRMATINQALAEIYGDLYIDHHGILTDPGVWDLAGITPTTEDLLAQEELRLPPSLAVDHAHQNNAADRVVTEIVRDRMVDLGWY